MQHRSFIAGQTVCLMSRPETKYVAVVDADVAYQILGEGPSDLLFFNGLGSHVEIGVGEPRQSPTFSDGWHRCCRLDLF